jgi:methionyl aminopeptidase
VIIIKSPEEIAAMRAAGRVVARTMEALKKAIRPGVTTLELDRIGEETIRGLGGIPAFKGHLGYPASLCVSVNEQVVHGIPGPRRLVEGDIVSIDVGAIVGGFVGDAGFTAAVGSVSEEARRLIAVTAGALEAGIAVARPGGHVSDISHAVEETARAGGFSVVREYVGHGVGRKMWEEPQVPNFGPPGAGPVLRSGMTLALEPMINAGTHEVELSKDGWTVVTKDGRLSAYFEHTIAILEEGPEILTALE